jgi:hypothetical protein
MDCVFDWSNIAMSQLKQERTLHLTNYITALIRCGLIAEFARKGYLRSGRGAVIVDLHLTIVTYANRDSIKQLLNEPLCDSALSAIDTYNPLTEAAVVGLIRYEQAVGHEETQVMIMLCKLSR